MSRRRKPPSRRPGTRRTVRSATTPSAGYVLYRQPPPFSGYEQWFKVPSVAAQMIEHPINRDPRASQGEKDLMNTVVKLGPRYHGIVPLAAVYLDQQLRTGTVNVAVTGDPDRYRPMLLADLAATLSNPEAIAELRAKYPEMDLPEEPGYMDADIAAFNIHELHAHGCLVLDNNHVLNMAIPPGHCSGSWLLNGHDVEDDGR